MSAAGIDLFREGDKVRVYVARGLALVSGPGGRTEVQSGERVTFEGAGTLYGIDRARPGADPEALQITAQTVTVTIRNGIAQTVERAP